jgi:pilus assembly protein CpaB
MKRTALVVCASAATGAALLGHLYLERLEAEVSGGPKVALVVAAEDVPLGSRVTDKVLAVRDVPQAYVDPRQVRASDTKRILGVRLSSELKANDPVLWSDMNQSTGAPRLLSGLVEHGMRAISFDARSSDFGGLLRPGDRVDVLFSEGDKGDGRSTRTLLQNLLVLAVGSDISSVDEATPRGGRAGSVTLAVTVEGAQIITQARDQGRLSLTLRNPDDIATADHLPETTNRTLERAPLAAHESPTRRAP